MIRFTVENFDENNLDKQVIQKLIRQHITLAARMDKLENYYNGHHAIENRTRGNNAPNNKISVNFAKYITDISTGYFMSNPITYSSTTGQDIQKLTEAFDHAYVDDTDADNAFEASQNGESYEYVYVSEGETELRTKNLCAKNTFLIYDTSIEEREVAGVYYRVVHDDAKNITKYIATVVTKHYIYEINILDGTDIQPIDGAPREHYFGEVPIISYQNNHNCIGDYEQVIPLIDAYNTTMSDRVNDVNEFCDAILILYGTLLSDDSETGEAKQALRDGKLLEFPDKQTMGAEWLTRQLDENGVEILQNAISRDILRMAYVPDFSDENFANNASGVAIAFKCLLLEWMTKTKERYYRKGLRKRIRLFCNFLGLKEILLTADSIVPHFARALPTNQAELAQIISMLSGTVSKKTLLQQLPFIEDPDAEIEAVEKENTEAVQRQQMLFSMRLNDLPPHLEEDDEPEDGVKEDDETLLLTLDKEEINRSISKRKKPVIKNEPKFS